MTEDVTYAKALCILYPLHNNAGKESVGNKEIKIERQCIKNDAVYSNKKSIAFIYYFIYCFGHENVRFVT